MFDYRKIPVYLSVFTVIRPTLTHPLCRRPQSCVGMFKVERRTKMERKLTQKAFLTLGLIFVLFVMIPSAAFSWNQATHAYISERLGAQMGHDNLSEMWGSVGPDLFNFIFTPMSALAG